MSGTLSLVDLMTSESLGDDLIIQPPGQSVYTIRYYSSSLQDKEYYWSLPEHFMGNKVSGDS